MASGSAAMREGCPPHFSALGVYVRPARSILSNALNFCRFAIAALVRSPCRYCPFHSPGGAPLPLAPPCNRQRPFSSLVIGRASRSSSALRIGGLSEIAWVVGFPGAHIIFQVQPLSPSSSLSTT